MPPSPAPSPAALKAATQWLATRRAQSRTSAPGRGALARGSAAVRSPAAAVPAVTAGAPHPTPADQPRWAAHLARGGWLAVLEAHAGPGWFPGRPQANPGRHRLIDLLDPTQVATLAPGATLYGPQDTGPWPAFLPKEGFQIWTTDPAELAALWAGLPRWVKHDWHDAHTKLFQHRAAAVFQARVTRVRAVDFGGRVHQAIKAEAALAAVEALGQQDAKAQTDLKRALGVLVGLEAHLQDGAEVAAALDRLLPVLARSMEGKQRLVDHRKAAHRARTRVSRALDVHVVPWRDIAAPLPPAVLR